MEDQRGALQRSNRRRIERHAKVDDDEVTGETFATVGTLVSLVDRKRSS